MFDTRFTYTFDSVEKYEYVWKGLSMLDDTTSIVKCDPIDHKITVYFKYCEYSKAVKFLSLFGRRVRSEVIHNW